MADDIARLGIVVDSQGVKEGADGLDRLTESAQAAESATGGAESAAEALANATRTIGGASNEAATAIQVTSKAAKDGSAGLNTLANTAQKASAGVSSLDDQIAAIHARFDSAADAIMGYGEATEKAADASTEAARSVGPLTSRFALMAVGVGSAVLGIVALVRAYRQGAEEGFAFNRALILSGNAADTNADRLQSSAASIDRIAGTQRNAAKVLAELAATGNVAAAQLEGAALAAVKLERSAGVAASETVKNFAALGTAPSAALLKLNEQYRFLTASTYAQVRALEDQGRASEAAAVAQRTFQEEISARADQVERHLGILPRLARGAGAAFREMWDELLNIGRPETLDEQIAEIQRQLDSGYRNVIPFDPGGGPVPEISPQERARLEAEKRRLQAMQNPDDYASRRARAENERREALLRDEQVLQDEAIKARERSQREAEQRRRVEASSAVAGIRRALATETEAYTQQLDLLEARRSANLVNETEYYGERRRLIDANADAQRRALEGEISRLQQESTRVQQAARDARAAAEGLQGLGSPELERALDAAARAETDAQQVQLQNAERIRDNREAILALDQRRAAQLQVLGVQEADYWASLNKATEEARTSLERYLALREQQRQRDLAGQGAGNLQREFDAGRSEIEGRFEQQRQQLERDRRNNPTVDPSIFREREVMLDAALSAELDAYKKHWENLRAGEANWLNGASEAIRNYIDSVANSAKRSETFIVSAMRGAEDAWVKFVQTGKLSFRDLINSVIADLARLSAQRAFASIFSALPFAGAAAAPASIPGAVIPFASGGVVSKPTMFGFSKGIGVMGEAGDEGILPLRRTRNGQLGVIAAGGGATPNVAIHNYAGAQVDTDFSNGELRILIREEARRLVTSETPRVIEAQMENPNSRVSKAMSRNTTAARQRN